MTVCVHVCVCNNKKCVHVFSCVYVYVCGMRMCMCVILIMCVCVCVRVCVFVGSEDMLNQGDNG